MSDEIVHRVSRAELLRLALRSLAIAPWLWIFSIITLNALLPAPPTASYGAMAVFYAAAVLQTGYSCERIELMLWSTIFIAVSLPQLAWLLRARPDRAVRQSLFLRYHEDGEQYLILPLLALEAFCVIALHTL